MALEGSQAFALLKTDQGENRRIAGVVVEVLGEDIVLGVGAPPLSGDFYSRDSWRFRFCEIALQLD